MTTLNDVLAFWYERNPEKDVEVGRVNLRWAVRVRATGEVHGACLNWVGRVYGFDPLPAAVGEFVAC